MGTRAVADAFNNILGQPKVRDFLRSSVKSDHVTHAYLFAGPTGSNKTQAAYALAQALLCPKGASGPRGGACGACENCTRARRKTHPDIHYYQPEGASGYLIGQVREIVADVALAPIQANRKVYIIDRADMLGRSAANAFLKTLEEPPDDVVMILLGRTRDSVLPTIASRCQVVPFRHIPPTEAAGIISQNAGCDLQLAREAMEACSGSISKAIAFLRASGNERVFFRTELLRRLASIDSLSDWDVVMFARDIVEKSKAPLDSLREKQEEDIAKNQDFLAKSAIRQIEEQNKRRLAAGASEYLKQALSIVASWLRDIQMIQSGAPDLVINTDAAAEMAAMATIARPERLLGALTSLEEAADALDYNVSPETVFDVVLLKVKEVFNDASCAG